MSLPVLRTSRLELVPGTAALFRADLENSPGLAGTLGAEIPADWPPPLMDDETLRQFIDLASDPSGPKIAAFYWVLDEDGRRVLVGNGGFTDEGVGMLALGYSVLDRYQGRGFATEAVAALVEFGFRNPAVRVISAYTYPDLAASIRVLEKNGFERAGPGPEPGTIAFQRRR